MTVSLSWGNINRLFSMSDLSYRHIEVEALWWVGESGEMPGHVVRIATSMPGWTHRMLKRMWPTFVCRLRIPK